MLVEIYIIVVFFLSFVLFLLLLLSLTSSASKSAMWTALILFAAWMGRLVDVRRAIALVWGEWSFSSSSDSSSSTLTMPGSNKLC